MRLHNHIAFRLLTDDTLVDEFLESIVGKGWVDKPVDEYAYIYDLLSRKNIDGRTPHTVYYVTHTVTDKLDLLKVKRKDNGEFDWSVFKHIPECKRTLIFEKNNLLRIYVRDSALVIAHLSFVFDKGSKNMGQTLLTIFAVDRVSGEVGKVFHTDPKVRQLDEITYKLLCFFFLSENTEEVLKPGAKKGTQRTGKIINDLPMPLIIVDSKWNITSVRTEGFPVSGHFRLQPCGPQFSETKMIWIDPFEKHGYIRKAKNQTA